MSVRINNADLVEAREQKPRAAARVVMDGRSQDASAAASPLLFSGEAAGRTNALAEIGLVLRQAREARTLGLADAAQSLNIFERHLRALEAGRLPDVARTFARGYLKNYAGLLGLDSAFLLASFDAATAPAKPADDTGSESSQAEQRARVSAGGALWLHNLFRLFGSILKGRSSWSRGGLGSPMNVLNAVTSAALPLLLLCVVAFAYYSIDAEKLESEASSIASLRAQSGQPEKLGPLASEAVAQVNTPVDATTLAVTTEAEPVQAPAVAQAASTPLPVAGNSAEPASAGPSAVPEDLPLLDAGRRSVASTITSQVRASGVITVGSPASAAAEHRRSNNVPGNLIADAFEPVGPGAVEMISQVQTADRLVITVYEDSWIDVRDNSGARLYRNLAKAGRRIDVSGELPFALHVGNVPGLEMRLNGEPVEITRYRSDNSARLTLASNH